MCVCVHSEPRRLFLLSFVLTLSRARALLLSFFLPSCLFFVLSSLLSRSLALGAREFNNYLSGV